MKTAVWDIWSRKRGIAPTKVRVSEFWELESAIREYCNSQGLNRDQVVIELDRVEDTKRDIAFRAA